MDISELKIKVRQYVEEHYCSEEKLYCFESSAEYKIIVIGENDVEEKKNEQGSRFSRLFKTKSKGLTDFVERRYKDIGEKILKFIKNRGDNYLDVYKSAEISPQLWHKYMTGTSKPGKDNMFRMAVVMDLDLDEAKQFLNLAGFGFSDCSKRDLVMEYFFKNGVSDYMDINSCLSELGLEPLFSE